MKIYLSRHGLRLNNVHKQYNNMPNPPIHLDGLQKLLEQKKKIEQIDYIFCSPFIRCVQTAWVYNTTDVPINIDYGLGEILRGDLANTAIPSLVELKEMKKHYFQINEDYKSYGKYSVLPERRRHSKSRVFEFLDWLKTSEYWGKNLLLVGHGFSVKDCLNYFGYNNPSEWNGKIPEKGKIYSIEI